jgi:hypothetical protein
LCLVAGSATKVLAYNGLGSDWRTQYPDVCQELLDSTTNQQNCILCHLSGSKDPQNAYGQAFKDANYNFAIIEDLDSDGDGRTNGEEILIDCSLPGDAVSPVDQDSWGGIKVLFR